MLRILKEPSSRYLLIGPGLISIFLFFWCASHTDLSKREAREGIPVVRMDRGDSLFLPKIHDQKLRTNPPVFYWTGLLSSKIIGGVHEISLRLPSILAGTATVFLTTLFAARLFSPIAGCMAGIILATAWRFTYLSSHARIDAMFTFFITLSIIASWEMVKAEDTETKTQASWWAALAMGFAVLTKGPLGLIFPLLVLLIFCRWTNHTGVPWTRLVLIPLAMVLAWFMTAWWLGGEPFQTMILQEVLGRIQGSESIQVHKQPIYYYIPQIFLGLAPWSLFLPVVLWQGCTSSLHEDRWRFPVIAVSALFIFLSLFSGKRGDYLLPLYPMAAVLIGAFLSAPSFNKKPSPDLAGTIAILSGLMVLSAILIVGLAVIPVDPDIHLGFLNSRDRWMVELNYNNHLPSPAFLAATALCMLAFAGGLMQALKNNSRMGFWRITAAWALFILIIVHGPVVRVINQYTTLKPFAQKVNIAVGNAPLLHYREIREDLLYYLDRSVEERWNEDAFQVPLDQPGTYLMAPLNKNRPRFEQEKKLKIVFQTDRSFTGYKLMESPTVKQNLNR